MSSDFRSAKFMSAFNAMDADGNGILEFSDFCRHAFKIKDAQGWDDHNPHFSNLIDAKKKFWTETTTRVKPATEDKITPEEWVSFFMGLGDQIKETGTVPDWVTRVHYLFFSSLDLDGDNKITPKEYDLYLDSLGVKAKASDVFDKIDLNGDGYIDLEELEELFNQWVISDDASDPGNYFVTGSLN